VLKNSGKALANEQGRTRYYRHDREKSSKAGECPLRGIPKRVWNWWGRLKGGGEKIKVPGYLKVTGRGKGRERDQSKKPHVRKSPMVIQTENI